jgi:nitroreductase
MQPSIFVVIKKEKIKNKIFEILEKKLKKLGISGRMIFIPTTMQAVKSAPVLIAIYNTGQFKNLVYKFARFANKPQCSKHIKIAEQAEISAVSAAIQNMILTIEELGLGSCWLHMPLYCEREINSLLGIKNKLVAFLALGYPAEKGERSSRKSFKNLVRF